MSGSESRHETLLLRSARFAAQRCFTHTGLRVGLKHTVLCGLQFGELAAYQDIARVAQQLAKSPVDVQDAPPRVFAQRGKRQGTPIQ
jgi:hypothetical protein